MSLERPPIPNMKEAVLAKIASMKELMHHSVNQTKPFSDWISQITKDQHLVLQTFSNRLLRVFFQGNPFFQLGISYEDELLEMHNSIFALFKKLTQMQSQLFILKSLGEFAKPFYPDLEIDKKLINIKDHINQKTIYSDDVEDREASLLDSIDKHYRAESHEVGETVLKKAFAILLYHHPVLSYFITNYILVGVERGGLAPTKYELDRAAELLQKLKHNTHQLDQYCTIVDLNQLDISQDKAILIKKTFLAFCKIIEELKRAIKKTSGCLTVVEKLRNWQEAINAFVCDDNDKLLQGFFDCHISVENQQNPLVQYLYNNLDKLQALQHHFYGFLDQTSKIGFFENAQTDNQFINKYQLRETSSSYQKLLQSMSFIEKQKRDRKRSVGLFENTQALDLQYENLFKKYQVCETHSKYKVLLNSLLFGAKQLHVPSVLISGNMILNGHGCASNAEIATKYFVTSFLLARTHKEKETAKKLLLLSLQKMYVLQGSEEDEDPELFIKIRVVVSSFEAPTGLRLKLGDDYLEKILQMAELFLEFYHEQVRLDNRSELGIKYLEAFSNVINVILTSKGIADLYQWQQVKKRIVDKLICAFSLVENKNENQIMEKLFGQLQVQFKLPAERVSLVLR